MCRPDITNWPLLKTALRDHYGDKIDRQTMMREFLQMTKHRHESILDFLERVKLTKSKVEVKIHIDTVLTAEQKRLLISQNELNALDILAANSDDGIRLILDIKAPATLAEASEAVTRHFHNNTRINNLFRKLDNSRTINKPPQIQLPKQNFPQFNQIPLQKRATLFPPDNSYTHRQNTSTAFPNYPPQNMFSNQSNFNRTIPRQNNFPSQPIPIQTRPIKQHFPTNQQVFGKPQLQKNVFAPKNEESYGNAGYDPSYNHETQTSHRGIVENTTAIKKHFYWPNLEQDVKNYVNSCEICQKTKYERHPNKLIFKATPIGSKPFQHLYIDSFKISGQYFITLIDSFSKFGQAYTITSLNAVETASKLIQYFSCFGIPDRITCDNGIEFKNSIIQDLCKMYQIELHYTTTYNPNSNSPVERFHSTIIEAIRVLREEKPYQDIVHLMNYAILSYNNSIHSATEFTPFQVAKGQLDLKNPFEYTTKEQISTYINEHTQLLQLMSDQLTNKLERKQRQNLERINRHRVRSLSLNLNQPLYAENNNKTKKHENAFVKLKNPVIKGDNKVASDNKIIHQSFVKLKNPVIKGDNKVASDNKIIHQRQLKPQRKIVVSDHQHEDDSVDSDDDNIPLSLLFNKSGGNQKSYTSSAVR
ncbi:Integrase zinc binding domain [Popillia japonica]|uniref:RNA-directed DNA polymerase n=1 Tax=Popillia japonica TaxID=7064 RepID=A0AAW1K1Y6_POPJA